MDPKILTEEGWKKIAVQFKIKDNGLQRALGNYDKLDEDDHDGCLKGIASVSQLAAALKKAKEVAAAPNALKYLTDLINAATAEARDVAQAKAKAKALGEKADIMEAKADAAKAKADAMEARAAAKAAAEEADEEDEDEEEGGDFADKLKKALKSLKTAKEDFHFVMCHDKPYGLVVSKTPISATHKKQLEEAAGGSKKHLPPGRCRLEGGTKLIFEMEKPPAPGFARIIQKWIKNATGLAFKVSVGGQSDEDEEEPPLTGVNPELQRRRPAPDEPSEGAEDQSEDEPPLTGVNPELKGRKAPSPGETPEGSGAQDARPEESKTGMTRPFEISATVGRGGKNKAEDVQAVQAALNLRAKAGLTVDGKCGPKTIAAIQAFQKTIGYANPDGLVEPGKATGRALGGEKVTVPTQPKAGAAGGGAGAKSVGKGGAGAAIGAAAKTVESGGAGGAAKAAESGAAGGAGGAASRGAASGEAGGGILGTVFGVAVTGVGAGVVSVAVAAIKAAQEAEARKKKFEAVLQGLLKSLQQAAENEAGPEGKQIKEELEKAVKGTQESIKKIEAAAKALAERKTAEAAKALKKFAEDALPGFKEAEDLAKQGSTWLEKNAPGIFAGAKDLAKQVTKDVVDAKKKADQTYNDIINKMKNAADDELGDEGKQIKAELEKAYSENQEHIRKVAEAAKNLATRETKEAAEVLQKAAEIANPQIKVVENLAQKAADWWNSD